MISPTQARERDFYAPNSETLAPDEMRVIACGTGMPTPRPAQAAACFLVELGNGEKFLFDIGDGSVERLFGLAIPTPRWTTYDAAFYGVDLPDTVPATIQDRAYTSPIWYTP